VHCTGFCWKFHKFATNINNLLPMMDEIHKYKDLKNDYSIRLKPVNRISDISQLIEWIQLKLGQAQNYIDKLNGLTEAFHYFYAEPGNPSDMEGMASGRTQ
jgi:hypothetical protein